MMKLISHCTSSPHQCASVLQGLEKSIDALVLSKFISISPWSPSITSSFLLLLSHFRFHFTRPPIHSSIRNGEQCRCFDPVLLVIHIPSLSLTFLFNSSVFFLFVHPTFFDSSCFPSNNCHCRRCRQKGQHPEPQSHDVQLVGRR